MERFDLIKATLFSIGFVLLLVAGYSLFLSDQSTNSIQIDDATFVATVADDADERAIGLGETESLSRNEAMLFVFDEPNKHGIWMKDVEYPIDVLWLDGSKQIVHIVENMQPESYPVVYQPESAALYVIEMAAGTIEDNAITKESEVNLGL